MRVLYFAWLRSKIGREEETIDLPDGVDTAGGLIDWLRGRGAPYDGALANAQTVKIAVNKTFANRDTPITDSDEVALFPPVTGG